MLKAVLNDEIFVKQLIKYPERVLNYVIIFAMLPVIFLMGPTASGKTDLAVQWVQRHPRLAIINADSALVYRGMDIGTAKPNRETLALAPHRLIDIRDPQQPYSAGDFRKDALREIQQIHQQGQIPLFVGGTMLYFWVLEHGLAELPSASSELRSELSAKVHELGWAALHTELKQVDPVAAARIHPQDGQRIQRALEVYRITGKPISVWHAQTPNDFSYPLFRFILSPQERSTLTARIQRRLKNLFDRGFIEEVANLRARGDLHPDLPALRAVGYRQIWEYLDGNYDLQVLHERVFYATCQLAKRQFTWLRRWSSAHWFDSDTDFLSDKVCSIIAKHD